MGWYAPGHRHAYAAAIPPPSRVYSEPSLVTLGSWGLLQRLPLGDGAHGQHTWGIPTLSHRGPTLSLQSSGQETLDFMRI
jgi:hypothetical protein